MQAAQQPQQQASPAEAIVSQIHQGLMKLMEVFQQAGLPPEDVQKLGGITSAFQSLIEDLSGNGQEKPESSPQGPMGENQAPDSRPV